MPDADKIVLVGLPGAGKSTVGRCLAERLDYRFVDLDEEVERLAGRTIREIFATDGEARFREWEAAASERQDQVGRTVLAAGGGWMARPELRGRWPEAVRVWLRIGPEEAWQRLSIAESVRPKLDPARPKESLQRLLAERQASYELAEISVPAGGSPSATGPQQTADLIVRLLPFAGRSAAGEEGARDPGRASRVIRADNGAQQQEE